MMWIALFCLSGLGLLASLGLGLAARKFAVEDDPKIGAVEKALPGINCGACGYPGCSQFARALVEGNAPVNGCIAGGEGTVLAVAGVMGVEAVIAEKRVAVVLCRGGRGESKTKFTYRGVEDCKAAFIVSGGDKACSYGCLGLGTCQRVCPFDAVEISEGGIAVINPEKCTGCGICVKECPKGIIQLVPLEKGVSILCYSNDTGSEVLKKCVVGCIACGACVRVCPFDAVSIEGNLAVLNYQRCRACGLCIPRCPTRSIEARDWPFPRVEIMEDTCTGCGICTMVCPVDAIEGAKKEVHRVLEMRCIGCLLCVALCPKEAIRIQATARSTPELAA